MGAGQSLPTSMSVEAEGKKPPGEGLPRWLSSKPPVDYCKHGAEIDNLYSMFARAAKLYPDSDCFGKRSPIGDDKLGPFEWVSYKTIFDKVTVFASGVATLSLPAKYNFGMYMANQMEFQIIALGCFSMGHTCVPIYDTLGDNIVQYEVNHAELPIIFLEASKLKAVANVLPSCPTLKHIVTISDIATLDKDVVATINGKPSVSLSCLSALMDAGKAKPSSPKPAGPDDLAYIMYTSGTTGDPKGVCIKQKSITVGASWCAGIDLYSTDRYLSFLPLAHIFETMVEHAILSVGGCVGFYNGNIKKVLDDILTLKPTLFVGVPRVYSRFYEQAMSKISASPLKNPLMYLLDSETVNAREGRKTIYGKILAKLLGAKITGGNVRIMISGAAPLPVHVHEFLLASMGCHVIQGYGMTENCANATLAFLDDYRAGHVGPPMPTVEIKLVDVPEMNYTTDGKSENGITGEVCTRGTVNFSGYHKNKEETDKVLTKDNWLHTGDIGRWNPDGTLSIIDRKKNIFKLSQGEYIAAEKIEMCVSKSKYVSQPWIYGNSFLPMLVAVVVPDFVELEVAAKAGSWFVEDKVAMCAKEEAKKFILDEMIKEGKAAKLKTFELPQAVHLEGKINELNQGFSIENDCLTPTFKLKRPNLLKLYKTEIDAMYVSLGENPKI